MKIVAVLLKTVGVILVVFILAMIAMAKLFISVNTEEQKDVEAVIKGGDREALLLYQESRGNFTKEYVDAIAEAVVKEGYTVTMNHPRADLTYNAADYDAVILISPIYGGKISGPLLKFVNAQDFTGKKVFALLTGKLEDKGETKQLKFSIRNTEVIDVVKSGSIDAATIDALKEVLK